MPRGAGALGSVVRSENRHSLNLTRLLEMTKKTPQDKSHGYDEVAEVFISGRNPRIGAATVRAWSRTLPRGSSILNIGCGDGAYSQVLIEDRFAVYGVDASAKMIAASRERFPDAHVECAAVEESTFSGGVAVLRAFRGGGYAIHGGVQNQAPGSDHSRHSRHLL